MVERVSGRMSKQVSVASRAEARGRLSKRQVADESWRETFAFFDVDHSGAISASELQQCLRALGQSLTEEQVTEMIHRCDRDGDGELNYADFVELMGGGRTITYETMKNYFEIMDRDASGYITTAEWRHDLTSLNKGLTDAQMDEVMDLYDIDGNGQLNLEEFELVIRGMGMEVVKEEEHLEDPRVAEVARVQSHARPIARPQLEQQVEQQVARPNSLATAKEQLENLRMAGEQTVAQPDIEQPRDLPKAYTAGERVAPGDARLAELLSPLADKDGKVCLGLLSEAVDLWKKHHSVSDTDPEHDPTLHWRKGRVKKGLGEVIYKANHIAIIVSDVGKSAAFYSDVIGLQQIRRPDFDRHGAWFTMGNMELHLIKGIPVVHSGKDLIVGHISIETYDIDKVPGILQAAGVPFRQNVSVPKGGQTSGSGTNDSNTSTNIVKQFFLRDPDGYYIEVCNCDVLTKYCLGNIREIAGYDQGASLDVAGAGIFVSLGLKIAGQAVALSDELILLGEELEGKSIAEIAQRVGSPGRAKEVDGKKLMKLLVRRTVYGDVCQNESEEDLKEILLEAGNQLPLAMKIMKVRANGDQIYAPPAFFEEGTEKVVPEKFHLTKA